MRIYKTHPLYTKRWQDIKDFVTRITKDIIYKKQNKLSKARLAFMEGFAYHWQLPSQQKGSRTKCCIPKHQGNVPSTTDDDTESDSPLFPSQPVSRKNNQTIHHIHQGARKQDLGGGSYTSYVKKCPTVDNTFFHPRSSQDTSLPYDTNSHPPGKYLGATAPQAIQILNSQPQAHTMTSNLALTPTVGDTGRSVLQGASAADTAQSSLMNPSGNNTLLTQLQTFTRQSTLEAHISQSRNQPPNFQTPTNTTLPT